MYYLGTLTGGSGAFSNAWMGPSSSDTFAIPLTTKALYLSPNIAGVQFELSQATGVSFLTTASRAVKMVTTGIFGPFRCLNSGPGNPTVISIYNPGLGTVSIRVYAG